MTDAKKNLSEPSLEAIRAMLTGHAGWLDRVCTEADAGRWGLEKARFTEHLARSVASRFKGTKGEPSWENVEAYLAALHLEDFSLACACADGSEAAWEFFVHTYRGYLRRCAGAMLRRAPEAPEVRDLADSLFAELYGVSDGRRGEYSLFRYFHGRSSLKTWLRAVLAQRHVDGVRATRRFDSLDDEDGQPGRAAADGSGGAERAHKNAGRTPGESATGPLLPPPDPYREEYIKMFCDALQSALGYLKPADHQRVCLYYAEGRTLAEIGRVCGEHESSVSRNLERIRRELRATVEQQLRRGRQAELASSERDSRRSAITSAGLSDAQIALCFQYATEESPIDFNLIFPGDDQSAPAKLLRRDAPGEKS